MACPPGPATLWGNRPVRPHSDAGSTGGPVALTPSALKAALSGTCPPTSLRRSLAQSAPLPTCPRPLKPARLPRDSRKKQQKHQLGPMSHKVRTRGGREPRGLDGPEALCQPGVPSLLPSPSPGPPRPGLSGRRVQKRVPSSSSRRRADPTRQLRAGSGHQPGRNRLGKASRTGRSHSVSGSTADGTSGTFLTPKTKSASITLNHCSSHRLRFPSH